MFGLRKEDLFLIEEVLRRHPDVKEAILFGSRAKGNQQPGSDVDIALKGRNLEAQIPQISGELNDELSLPYCFDVLDYDHLENSALKEHIQRVGIRFYSA